MKRLSLAAAIAIVLSISSIVVWASYGQSPNAPIFQFEYRTDTMNVAANMVEVRRNNNKLNTAGRDGWELITVQQNTLPDKAGVSAIRRLYIFKRQKRQ